MLTLCAGPSCIAQLRRRVWVRLDYVMYSRPLFLSDRVKHQSSQRRHQTRMKRMVNGCGCFRTRAFREHRSPPTSPALSNQLLLAAGSGLQRGKSRCVHC